MADHKKILFHIYGCQAGECIEDIEKRQRKTEHLGIRITPTFSKRLKELAKNHNLNQSELVNYILEQWVKN